MAVARNKRSEATRRKLLDAVVDLLEEGRDIAALSVNDICIVADVSPSSMYNLYSSKDDLLVDVHQRFIEGVRERVVVAAAERDWSSLPPRELVRGVLDHFVQFERDHEAEIAAMVQLRRGSRALTDKHLRNETEMSDMARDLVLAALGRSNDEEAAKRVDFVMMASIAVVQRAFFSHRPVENLLGIEESEFLDRLADMILAYLEMDDMLD